MVARLRVELMLNRRLLKMEIAAQNSAQLQCQINFVTFGRGVNVVAGVGDVFKNHTARCAEIVVTPTSILPTTTIANIAARYVTNIFIFALTEGYKVRRVFADRSAQSKLAAGIFAHVLFLESAVDIVIAESVGAIVELEANGSCFAIEPRVPISKRVAVRVCLVAALLVHYRNQIARAAKVRIGQTHHADNAVSRRIARAYAECARAFFLDVDFHNNRVGLDARIHF